MTPEYKVNPEPPDTVDQVDKGVNIEEIVQEIYRKHEIHIDANDPVIQAMYLMWHQMNKSTDDRKKKVENEDDVEEMLNGLQAQLCERMEEMLTKSSEQLKLQIEQFISTANQRPGERDQPESLDAGKTTARMAISKRAKIAIYILTICVFLSMAMQLVLLYTVPVK